MRNIERRRNIAVAVTGTAASVLAAGFALGVSPDRAAWFGVTIAAFVVALIAGFFASTLQLDVRRRHRLLRGDRLLAAYTVNADTWSQFVALQKMRTDNSQDRVQVRSHQGSTGIQVMISELSVLIDDDFHHLSDLRELTWHETVPPYFDFRSTTYTGSQWETWHLRIPSATDDSPAMRRVWDYFQARLVAPTWESRAPRLRFLRNVCVALIPLGMGAVMVARAYRDDATMQGVVMAALLVAMLALPIGVIVGGVTHYRLRRGGGKSVSPQTG
jgi:hypothetical protein